MLHIRREKVNKSIYSKGKLLTPTKAFELEKYKTLFAVKLNEFSYINLAKLIKEKCNFLP